MEIHEMIKELREKQGLSQESLAEKVGYKDRSSIAKIEAGLVDLAQSKIAAFADALGVSPSYLLGWSDIDAQLTEVEKEVLDTSYISHISHFYKAMQETLGATEICNIVINDLNDAGREKLLDYIKLLRKDTAYLNTPVHDTFLIAARNGLDELDVDPAKLSGLTKAKKTDKKF